MVFANNYRRISHWRIELHEFVSIRWAKILEIFKRSSFVVLLLARIFEMLQICSWQVLIGQLKGLKRKFYAWHFTSRRARRICELVGIAKLERFLENHKIALKVISTYLRARYISFILFDSSARRYSLEYEVFFSRLFNSLEHLSDFFLFRKVLFEKEFECPSEKCLRYRTEWKNVFEIIQF